VTLLRQVYGPSSPPVVPDCLLPHPDRFSVSFDDELERVAAVEPDQLVADLAADGILDSAWIDAARSPARWLHQYVLALRRAWAAVEPLWHRARPLVERETERVGVALAKGAFGHLLDSLHPRGHVEDDRFHVRHLDGPVTLARDLVLVPMVIGPQASLTGMDDGRMSYLAYPLPGARRLDVLIEPTNGLSDLLGRPRADVLRRLDRPTTAGQLATALLLTPSAMTHHLAALERAGLVRRERTGQYVHVHRTARGSGLVALYE
jgi:DNA-binding transcriptional ArsR family regulator